MPWHASSRFLFGGVARYVGSAAAEVAGFDLRDRMDFDLACAGVPVTVAESGTKILYLTEKSRREMTEADAALLSSGASVDVSDIEKYPLAARRKRLLDDLDAASGGLSPVCIDACRVLRILPRVRPDGRLDSVTILNLSIGGTDEIAVRVRRPLSTRAILQTLESERAVSCGPGSSGDEWIVDIPNIAGWQIATLFF